MFSLVNLRKSSFNFSLCLSLLISACNESNSQTGESPNGESTISITNQEIVPIGLESSKEENAAEITKDSYDRHSFYFSRKSEILHEFKIADSLELWDVKKELIDPDSTWTSSEGSGWSYSINDSIEYYSYRIFGESCKQISYFYVRKGNLLMHRDIETVYNAPFGYDKEQAFAEGDSTIYGEPQDFEELSIFDNNKIIYQLSPDCGAPNSQEYIDSTQKDILDELKIILELIAQQ